MTKYNVFMIFAHILFTIYFEKYQYKPMKIY